MKIRYLEAMYGLLAEQEHVAVPGEAERRLNQMAKDLVGTEDLIAIYVPLATPEIYDPKNVMRGKILGAVRLLKMPSGKDPRCFFFKDWIDDSLRWPIGWPCEVVLYPPDEARFELKPLVELVHGAGQFAAYAAQFQHGPVEVRADLGVRLLDRLKPFPRPHARVICRD